MSTTVIAVDNPNHAKLVQAMTNNRGARTFDCFGTQWRAIMDGRHYKFIQQNNSGFSDQMYASRTALASPGQSVARDTSPESFQHDEPEIIQETPVKEDAPVLQDGEE